MKIKILKNISELRRNELVSIFETLVKHNLDEHHVEELKIKHGDSYVTVDCYNTGFSLIMYDDYSIKVSSSVTKQREIRLIEAFHILTENKIIEVIN